MLRIATLVVVVLAPFTRAAAQSEPNPTNLKDCYLRVAVTKTNPDAMFIAREICDALFKKHEPASLATYDPRTTKCTETWFDGDGRYESADVDCAFEARGEGRFVYACESKDPRTRKFTYNELTRSGDRFEKTKSAGYDAGALFASLTACIAHKAQQPGVKSE